MKRNLFPITQGFSKGCPEIARRTFIDICKENIAHSPPEKAKRGNSPPVLAIE
jgi:hypothetical protein